MEKAIFFDKDGTLVENVPFNVDPEKIVFSRGAVLALSVLKSSFQFHIVSNQAGVALGHFKEEELVQVKDKLSLMFREAGAVLSGFHYCPHDPRENCRCRKPLPLLIEQAAKKHEIQLTRSWMIGDILDDVESGNRAGCRTILIDNGNETEWVIGPFRAPEFVAEDLEEAAMIILNEEEKSS